MEPNNAFMSFESFKDQLQTWKQPLQAYLESNKFKNLYQSVKQQYQSDKKIYPPKELIFNCFQKTPFQNVKAVIIGQDPYHQPNQAHGFCFSVKKPLLPPPALRNIYKNLSNDPILKLIPPQHGDLTKWADQGVLLLNSILTVEDSKPNSHAKNGWQDFTSEVINLIDQNLEGVVFFLWGKPNQDRAKNVDTAKHYLLMTSHPSPLAVSQGFQKSNHFSKCNQILISNGKAPIDWNLDP